MRKIKLKVPEQIIKNITLNVPKQIIKGTTVKFLADGVTHGQKGEWKIGRNRLATQDGECDYDSSTTTLGEHTAFFFVKNKVVGSATFEVIERPKVVSITKPLPQSENSAEAFWNRLRTNSKKISIMNLISDVAGKVKITCGKNEYKELYCIFNEQLDRKVPCIGKTKFAYFNNKTTTPYLHQVTENANLLTDQSVMDKLTCPRMIELIWSYWMEEGMLVQALNAISLRFQNRRISPSHDGLRHLNIDPLRPLAGLLWGYIEGEKDRLSVARRTYEYDHHYGLRLIGRAAPSEASADSRSKFLGAFHGLLNACAHIFKEIDDNTIQPDAFPLLSHLREVQIILAEGAHNQYGDLPWQARIEMLTQQYLLSQKEMREFLGGRIMVPYPEKWMDNMDTMKKIMGWTDTSITHFHTLATFGEILLLSIRHGAWFDPATDRTDALAWVTFFRKEIQGYIHAYASVTGVNLASELMSERIDSTVPGILIKRRLRSAS
ncbi:hypothetical protein K1X84_09985 [bacterium]|nr:hypothetical protein [bacterium]